MVSDESFCINISNDAQYIVSGGLYMNKNKELSEDNGKQTQLKWIKIFVSSIERITKNL